MPSCFSIFPFRFFRNRIRSSSSDSDTNIDSKSKEPSETNDSDTFVDTQYIARIGNCVDKYTKQTIVAWKIYKAGKLIQEGHTFIHAPGDLLIAEYHALLFALECAHRMGINTIKVESIMHDLVSKINKPIISTNTHLIRIREKVNLFISKHFKEIFYSRISINQFYSFHQNMVHILEREYEPTTILSENNISSIICENEIDSDITS